MPWLVVDTETTGLNPAKHSILSIGIVPVNNNFEIIIEPYHEFVLPVGEIDPEALKINQIDIRKITKTREQVANEIIEWLTTNQLIGTRFGQICHSYPFDYSFIQQIPVDWNNLFDRHVLDIKIIAQFLKSCGAKNINSTNLDSLSSLVPNLKLEGHNALNDCLRTLAVLKFFIEALTK